MAKVRSSELNRISLSVWAPADGVGSTNFNLIDLSSYKTQAIAINKIVWGSLVPDATDRTNFLYQYCALLRNAKISDTAGMSATAPLAAGGTTFSDLIWMDGCGNLTELGKAQSAFPIPLIISGADNPILYLPSPLLTSGSPNSAIYTYVGIYGQPISLESAERYGDFRLV